MSSQNQLPSPEPGLGWFPAMSEDDLWVGDVTGIILDQHKLLLVNFDGTVHAYDDKCPHKGTTLSDGTLEDGVLVCPTHHWEFDVRNGEGINPAESCLKAHPVAVVDGQIWVALANHENPEG
jgi:nitrite reductase/ring-hydroxylating ferredoxin subunit